MTREEWQTTFAYDPRTGRMVVKSVEMVEVVTNDIERLRLIADYKVATTKGPVQKAWLKKQFELAPRIYQ